MLSSIAVLLAMALAATLVCAHSNCTEPTECLQNATSGLSINDVPHQLVLTWQCDADRAAAALLLHLLEASGYCRLKLCEASAGPCKLSENLSKNQEHALVMGIEKGDGDCTNNLKMFKMHRPAGVAPVFVRLHVRLGAASRSDKSCLAATTARIYANATGDDGRNLLRHCGFKIVKLKLLCYVPGTYIYKNDLKLPVELNTLDLKNRTRIELNNLVDDKNSNDSFLFLDTELWTDHPLVNVVHAAFPSEPRSVGASLNYALDLKTFAPGILGSVQKFTVSTADLRELLKIEESDKRTVSPSKRALEAAAIWARQNDTRFKQVMKPFQLTNEPYIAVAYLCEDGGIYVNETYRLMEEIIAGLKNKSEFDHIEVILEKEQIDCLAPNALKDKLDQRMKLKGRSRLFGAVVAGAGVPKASNYAASLLNMTLIAYDAQPGSESTLASGARADYLGNALLHALGECKWRRVALLSERSLTAEGVMMVLRDGQDTWVEEQEVYGSQKELRSTLIGLYSRGARVFVVNASGRMVRAVLETAARLEEQLAGSAWLAREWPGPGAPPLPLLALRLGEDQDELGLLNHSAAWPGAPAPEWRPPHVVPLSDALWTLVLTLAKVVRKVRYDLRAPSIFQTFRKSLKPNVKANLMYNVSDGKAKPPQLRLERWNVSKPEYEYWNVSGCQAPVQVNDGYCEIHGSSFEHCYDSLVTVGTPALLLVLLALGYVGAALRRRTLAKRQEDRRRERATAVAALLVRQKETVPALLPWLVDREEVRLVRELGAGRFGCVWLAALGAEGRDGFTAAKAPLEGSAPAEEGELLREAAALAPLRHEHVVRLVGVCLSEGPPLVLMEPAFFGDLLRYLRARRPLALSRCSDGEAEHVSAAALTRLAREAALALAYLAGRGMVHCDVRAANCLVDERRSLKLADFGMARATGGAGMPRDAAGGGEYACRRRALFPVLWMAPESLERGVFSHASDVWALGVLALEMVTLGARPFGALEARAAVRLVIEGGHARLPAAASPHTRWLARACWQREASARPSAETLAAWLERRPRAVEPALSCDMDAEDGDSGFAEPPDTLPDTNPS